MAKLRTAVIGTGFVGRVHLEAIHRLGFVDVAAIVDPRLDQARALADEFGVARAEADYKTVLADPSVQAVHVCTPNVVHFEISAAALAARKHVLCEKPLAMTTGEAAELVKLAAASGLRNCTCHNLRYYPMVQQMRRMREAGELGEILIAQGTYSQDWLMFDTDWNWRVQSKEAGALRAMGDIGSHWCDTVEHVTGLRISSMCADLATFHKTRKRPAQVTEAFATAGSDHVEEPVNTEDFAAVLLHFGARARGAFTVSQVSGGCKNRLSLEIYGTKASVMWNAERPDELWVGRREAPNQLMLKDPSLLNREAAKFADLPGGHGEGYGDTFKQVFRRFYRSILDPKAPPEYPQFADGLRVMELLETSLASHQKRGWVDVRSGS
jgi:predicted dehydrogenase